MPVLKSDVDTRAAEFTDNVAAMEVAIADIHAVVDEVKLGGGERANVTRAGARCCRASASIS